MFATIGRFDDRSTLNRHLLAAGLLLTSAWTALWVAVWVWVLAKLTALLHALLVLLFTLLFPNAMVPPLQMVAPPVAVEIADPPLPDLSPALDGAADAPPLDAQDLADASAEWEARQRAAEDAKRRKKLRRDLEDLNDNRPMVLALVGTDTAKVGVLANLSDGGSAQLDDVFAGGDGGVVGGIVGGTAGDGLDKGQAIELVGAGEGGGGIENGLGRLDRSGGRGKHHGAAISVLGSLDAGRPLDEAAPEVRVSVRVESVTGTLPADAVQHVLDARSAALRACWQRRLDRDPREHGHLRAAIDVGAGGRVGSVTTLDATVGDDVARCALQTLRDAHLPAPADGKDSEAVVRLAFVQ